MQPVYQPDLFHTLPAYMRCTDDPSSGMEKLPKLDALQRAYIAPNPRNLICAMAFDIDRPAAAVAWEDARLPPPSWVTKNPASGHAHHTYLLNAPVARSMRSRNSPQRYLARIQHGMTARLKADASYSHVLTQTPHHERWVTWIPTGRHVQLYELDYLRDFLGDDLPLRIRREAAVGEGRNVTLFDGLRFWAYRARPDYDNENIWHEACRERAHAINIFACPLPLREVDHTARSVAKWTWKHFSLASFRAVQEGRGKARAAQRASVRMDRQAQLLMMRGDP